MIVYHHSLVSHDAAEKLECADSVLKEKRKRKTVTVGFKKVNWLVFIQYNVDNYN